MQKAGPGGLGSCTLPALIAWYKKIPLKQMDLGGKQEHWAVAGDGTNRACCWPQWRHAHTAMTGVVLKTQCQNPQ